MLASRLPAILINKEKQLADEGQPGGSSQREPSHNQIVPGAAHAHMPGLLLPWVGQRYVTVPATVAVDAAVQVLSRTACLMPANAAFLPACVMSILPVPIRSPS